VSNYLKRFVLSRHKEDIAVHSSVRALSVKVEIFAIMSRLAREGYGILFISSAFVTG